MREWVRKASTLQPASASCWGEMSRELVRVMVQWFSGTHYSVFIRRSLAYVEQMHLGPEVRMTLELILMVVAATQASTAPNASQQRDGHTAPSRGKPFMSPMGEPFLGRSSGEDGLVVWFEQADKNHDGVITVDEMTADAARFYQTLDLNHDGEIDPDEIAHYETVIAPEVRTGRMTSSAQQASGDSQRGGFPAGHQGRRGGGDGGHGGGGHRGGGHGSWGGGEAGGVLSNGFGGDEEAGAGRYGLLQIPEPVASADADFNRGVSLEEFRGAAAKRFELLDVDHTGKLTLSNLEAIRRAAASAARRPSENEPSSEDQSDGNAPM